MPNDHYVPRFYLAKFEESADSGRNGFWVYDKRAREPRFQTAVNTAKERNFSSVCGSEGEEDRRIESFLAVVEARAAPVLARWQAPGAKPDAEGIATMSIFLAWAYRRVPRQIQSVREATGAAAREEVKILLENEKLLTDTLASYQLDRGESLGTVEHMRRCLASVGDRIRLQGHQKGALVQSLALATDALPHLLALNWSLCRPADGASFLTSDSPVCIFSSAHEDAGWFGAGFDGDVVEVTFPISSSVCLRLDRRHATGRAAISSSMVNEFNRRMVWNAERFVIASQRSKRTERLVEEFKGTQIQPKVDVVEVGQSWRQTRLGFTD